MDKTYCDYVASLLKNKQLDVENILYYADGIVCTAIIDEPGGKPNQKYKIKITKGVYCETR